MSARGVLCIPLAAALSYWICRGAAALLIPLAGEALVRAAVKLARWPAVI